MIALIVLLLVNIVLFCNFKEDPVLLEVKEKYKTFREHLKTNGDEKYKVLHNEIPIVAYRGSLLSGVGYNSNKGGEYSHSNDFWDNYTELKNEAIRIGIYENIDQLTPFCGKKIVDK